MPIVIANWFSDTSQPREFGGASSEMYSGTAYEATPIARPTSRRAVTSTATFGENADAIAPIEKLVAAANRTTRRPRTSVTRALAIAPMVAPISTELTTSSTSVVLRPNAGRMKRIAPEITPVS